MAETSLVKRLGIKPGHKLLILNAPEGYVDQLDVLPEGATLMTTSEHLTDAAFDFVHLFVRSKAEVDAQALAVMSACKPGGLVWFSYPKLSGKIKVDITRNVGWETVSKAEWRPVTAISIDDTWSALRFRPLSEVKVRAK